MPIQTSCPGCGGPIYIEDRSGMAVCQFCGTRFKVNLDETAPRLQVDTRPPVEEPEPVVAQQEEWHPPQPEPPDAPYIPPPVFQPKPAQSAPEQKILGGKLWLVIAIVVGAVVIGSCLCLVLTAKLFGFF